MTYFLEVFIAREVVEAGPAALGEKQSSSANLPKTYRIRDQ